MISYLLDPVGTHPGIAMFWAEFWLLLALVALWLMDRAKKTHPEIAQKTLWKLAYALAAFVGIASGVIGTQALITYVLFY